MEYLILGLIIFALIAFFINIIPMKGIKTRENSFNEMFDKKIQSLSPNKKYIGYYSRDGILINDEKKQVSFIESEGSFFYSTSKEEREPIINIFSYNYNDILESHLIENDKSISSSSRGSQIGGAIIGGILAGGVGAAIGGLSGKKETLQIATKLELKVLVNDKENPIHIITFFISSGTNKNDMKYKEALKNVYFWQGLFEVIIKQADDEIQAKKTIGDVFNA